MTGRQRVAAVLLTLTAVVYGIIPLHQPHAECQRRAAAIAHVQGCVSLRACATWAAHQNRSSSRPERCNRLLTVVNSMYPACGQEALACVRGLLEVPEISPLPP